MGWGASRRPETRTGAVRARGCRVGKGVPRRSGSCCSKRGWTGSRHVRARRGGREAPSGPAQR